MNLTFNVLKPSVGTNGVLYSLWCSLKVGRTPLATVKVRRAWVDERTTKTSKRHIVRNVNKSIRRRMNINEYK